MKTWEDCVEFHGHECGGLAIGYKVSLYAMKLLDINFSQDEELVCVTENDACSVDGIQVMLGCTVGKGNLLFKLRGKQAYTFFNRTNGKSVRIVLNDFPRTDKNDAKNQIMNMDSEELFQIKNVTFELPEKARIFLSIPCDQCGEKTAEHLIRCENGKKLCLDCFQPYTRNY